MNIVGCDDLGALFLTIVTCVTVGATSVRPQRDRSLRKERPRIRLTIAWEANGLPYGIDVAYEFTYGAPRSYPRAPSLAALPQFTLSHPTGYRSIKKGEWMTVWPILHSDSLRAAFGGCSLDAHCGGCLHFQFSIIYQPNEPNGLENP